MKRGALVGVVALALAGCASSPNTIPSGSKNNASEPAAFKAAQPSSRLVAEDRKLGERALLRQSDFPAKTEYAGGLRQGEESSSVSHLLHDAAKTCLHSPDPVVTRNNPATVWSGEYGDSTDEGAPSGYPEIENLVTVEQTEEDAKQWYATFSSPRAASCIGEADRAVILQESPGLRDSGNSVSKASVAPLRFPRYGEQSIAYREKVPLYAEGHSYTTYTDYVLVRNGRAQMIFRFEKLDAPQRRRLEERLIMLTASGLRE